MAKIDIVVPCYNYGRFLSQCVRSVLEQSVCDLRVLIIDDASTDDSLYQATSLAKQDPRVTVVAHRQNQGHIRTYNEGIAWASADYFLLLSADDLLVPGALERAIEIMDENPDVVLTHGGDIVWFADQPPPSVPTQRTCTWARHDLISEICAAGTNLVATPTAIGRTEIQKQVGGYKQSLPHAGDMEMWLRFAAHGAVVRIDAIQAIYRKHSSAMSNAYFATMLSDYRQRRQAFESFFEECGHRLTNSGALRARTMRVMVNHALRCGVGLIRRGRLNDGFQLVGAAVADQLRPAAVSQATARDDAKSSWEAQGKTLPLVSVVMCAYNAGKFLRPALASVLSQTYKNLEVIIIDDGSTDGSFASVADMLTDTRVLVRHQQNATRPVALNRALDLVRGDFYAIQDGDDISHPTRIEKQVEAMLKHPDLAAVFCGCELIMDERPIAPTFAPMSVDHCKREIRAFRMPAHDPTGMFRMSLVNNFRYEPTLPFIEAFDYVLRVGEQHPMLVLGECLYGYRILQTSITRRDPTERELAVTKVLKRACTRRGIEYDRVFAQQRSKRSKNSVLDNNLAAHFMTSVLDQRAIGNRWGALGTALACARLHPFDSHYYKALVYAIVPEKLISLVRGRRPLQQLKINEQALSLD